VRCLWGSGLSATFRLESGIKGDTGAAGGKTQSSASSLLNRLAYVGLGAKSFGEMRLGHIETLSREITRLVNSAGAKNEPYIADSVDPLRGPDSRGYQARPLFHNFGTRVDNAVSYRSPLTGVVQVIATASLSEKSAPGTPLNNQVGCLAAYRGLGLIVIRGPFEVALSCEVLTGGGIDGGSFNRTVTVGANYDFGAVHAVLGATSAPAIWLRGWTKTPKR
jgi:predicted porin